MRQLSINVVFCVLPLLFVQTAGQSFLETLLLSLNPQANAPQPRPKTIDEEILEAAGADVFHSPVSNAEMNEYLLEGDIVMTASEMAAAISQDTSLGGGLVRKKRKTPTDVTKRWTDNTVLMAFDSNSAFTPDQHQLFQRALDEWQQKTCVRFRTPTMNDINQGRSFIFIQNGRGCSSPLGMNPMRTVGAYKFQPLTLAPSCRVQRIMMHEIGHSLGLIHEQSRSDRDGNINVVWKNVPIHMRHNFQKFTTTVTDNRNTPYDYQSLMHYGPRAFSNNGEPTIQTIDTTYQDRIGSFNDVSQYDADAINNMYNCRPQSSASLPWWWHLVGGKK